jgi:cell division protein FtsZ
MKQYNYSFHKGNQNIDEYENIPAYKRMNVELDDNPSSSEPVRSRTSVDFDENGIKLRTNNSFLHDNVD